MNELINIGFMYALYQPITIVAREFRYKVIDWHPSSKSYSNQSATNILDIVILIGRQNNSPPKANKNEIIFPLNS